MGRRPKHISENEDLREKILGTALQLFTTKGYFNTSVQDIRRDADISIGAVYHHFPGKEDIAKALYGNLLEKITREFQEIMGRYDTAHDRCRAVMALLFDLTESNPAEMEFMLYAKHREFIPSAIPICSSKPLSMMREMVQLGIANKEIKDMEIVLVTSCLFGGMFRMINLRLDCTIEGPLSKHLETIWECAWRGVAL
ncbi:MAG TPA: TetR/AcrR family transcriptional regulator [Desulfuromonadaceae bacterium]